MQGCAVDTDCGDVASNRACDVTSHQCQCQTDYHDCGGACVANNAPTSCGTSCTACPSDALGTATCDGQKCGIRCSTGALMCGAACLMCSDAHGTASCGASNVCSLVCQSGYNLCAGRCVATTATAACKGQCASAACSWTPHASTVVASSMDIDVDAAGVTHAATINQRGLVYYQIIGAGAPMTEGVGNTAACWGFDVNGAAVDTQPLVRGDGSGKARIMCGSGNVLNSFTWTGSAWNTTRVYSTSTSQDSVQGLVGAGNRIAFYIRPYLSTTDSYFNFAELTNNAWVVTRSIAIGQPAYDYFVGGAPGAAKVAWISPRTRRPNSTC